MRPLFRLLLLGLAWIGTAALAAPLLAPAELQTLVSGSAVRVIDTRPAPEFAQGHIAGAVSAPYGAWRGPATNPGELPPLPKLTALVQSLGLAPETPVVIVYAGRDSSDFGSAARVYWTLKSLGLHQLSVLDGGLKAWQGAGLPLTTQVATVARSTWQPVFDTRWQATRAELESTLQGPHALLVDARPAPFFEGRAAHDAAGAWGTLPGAVNLDNARFFKPGSAALLEPAELARVAASASAPAGPATVSFCNTGHWAATDWFVRSEVLGQPDARLYAGSMVDWTQAATPLPVANQPGRLMQLWYTAAQWLSRVLA